jgi:hypothetical protein
MAYKTWSFTNDHLALPDLQLPWARRESLTTDRPSEAHLRWILLWTDGPTALYTEPSLARDGTFQIHLVQELTSGGAG